MPIKIKIAETAKELNDVYKLRYQVYAKEEGRFENLKGDIIVDQFDTLPNTSNIIAYIKDEPIGTIRINLDSEILLPGDEHFDFGPYRSQVSEQLQSNNQTAVFCCASMLAITEQWRGRRGLFRALFKLGCDVCHAWGVTHVISTVSIDTAALYHRLQFEALSDKIWSKAIGDHIVPMGSPIEPIYDWAFGEFKDKHDLMENFSGCFEYLVVEEGTKIFNQGEVGHEAYLISEGRVHLSQWDPDIKKSMVIETLDAGSMFGELPLIDDHPRSATAIAITKTELIVLNRKTFWQKTHEDPHYAKGLLQILAKRLRDFGERAFNYAHSDENTRLKFFINTVLSQSHESVENQGEWVAIITIEEYAHLASVSKVEASSFLLGLQLDKRLTVTKTSLIFHGRQPI
ncbi:MAG: cyclic nucleotide-binding domain-containing protein [Psychrosphaera sp.]|nr:cyclic nucleotide-binding domain-containing protein [Psychrosphaera sp.]